MGGELDRTGGIQEQYLAARTKTQTGKDTQITRFDKVLDHGKPDMGIRLNVFCTKRFKILGVTLIGL